jgi:hypothetical protein
VAVALYRSLEAALTRQCAHEYDTGVTIQCRDEPTEEAPELSLRIDCPGLVQMPARYTVTHAGGNVYEVSCAVEDDASDETFSRRFSYSVPIQETETEIVRLPTLGKKVATFFRHELEKHVGRHILQNPLSPSRQSQPSLS